MKIREINQHNNFSLFVIFSLLLSDIIAFFSSYELTRYLRNAKSGYPDINTIKKTILVISMTVDKFDCIISEHTIIVGSIIYKKIDLNEGTSSL